MAYRDDDRLRSYLELITKKHGGPEAVLDELHAKSESMQGGFESTGGALESVGLASQGPDSVGLARQGMESLSLGQSPPEDEYAGLEAIIDADIRPAINVIGGTFTVSHPLWMRLSDDAAIKKRIEAVIPSVGRIELPGNPRFPYGGTGFVVGAGLIMTNRHVAEIFASGLGDRRLSFVAGAKAGIDFLQELGRPSGPPLTVRRVVMIHPYWDMAILAVEGLPAGQEPLKLSLTDARDLAGHDIFVIGYPAFDPRNPATEQRDLFGGKFGVKRLQPGQLHDGMKTASFGKMVPAATHDCSTLGGNSGSAVFGLDTGEVLALHFGGLYHKQNYCVPSFELARDDRVIAAGVSFVATPPGGANEWSDWWKQADETEAAVRETSDGQRSASSPTANPAKGNGGPSVAASKADGSVSIEVPLRITISLGSHQTSLTAKVTSESVAEDTIEALQEPFRDTDYSSRTGYDTGFLNAPGQDASLSPVDVPMPGAADPAVLARTKTGADVLHYQNFSLRMHAQRRLALVTASNVTKEAKLRKPDPSADYTRKGLSGLGENDQERWYLDPRLDDKFQIPDVFFTKDRKAFDKGHIVRRDDVAWGATYQTLRRANGDSYHVTNCSPQVAGFNRSASGVDNWGDLENHVLSEAANERLCVFAGPVLDSADEVFVGKGDGGTTLRAKIPSRFWKVIVARGEDSILAYGFVLEQDLSAVEWEFAVAEEFVKTMHSLAEIEAMTGVSFDAKIRNADQLDTVRGVEIARRSGARRGRKDT